MSLQCSECNCENGESRRFCHNCGASLYVDCFDCAFENGISSKFCGGCGLALRGDAESADSSSSDSALGNVMYEALLFKSILTSNAIADSGDEEPISETQTNVEASTLSENQHGTETISEHPQRARNDGEKIVFPFSETAVLALLEKRNMTRVDRALEGEEQDGE